MMQLDMMHGALALQCFAKKLEYGARCTGLGRSEAERACLELNPLSPPRAAGYEKTSPQRATG